MYFEWTIIFSIFVCFFDVLSFRLFCFPVLKMIYYHSLLWPSCSSETKTVGGGSPWRVVNVYSDCPAVVYLTIGPLLYLLFKSRRASISSTCSWTYPVVVRFPLSTNRFLHPPTPFPVAQTPDMKRGRGESRAGEIQSSVSPCLYPRSPNPDTQPITQNSPTVVRFACLPSAHITE